MHACRCHPTPVGADPNSGADQDAEAATVDHGSGCGFAGLPPAAGPTASVPSQKSGDDFSETDSFLAVLRGPHRNLWFRWG